jgi:hypothetical protein
MPNKLLDRFTEFWKEMRGEKELPFRKGLDISLIPDLLPYIVLVDAKDRGNDFYISIAGEYISDNYGGRLAKRPLSELIVENPSLVAWRKDLRACMGARNPIRIEDEFTTKRGIQKRFYGVIAPLTVDGASVDALLCCFVHLQRQGDAWIESRNP